MPDSVGWLPLHCLALAIKGCRLDGVSLRTSEGTLECIKIALEFGVSVSSSSVLFTFIYIHHRYCCFLQADPALKTSTPGVNTGMRNDPNADVVSTVDDPRTLD
jgi:hypothetical protein